MMTKSTTRTQLRGTCPACFAQQALKNGKMVAHGYTRPQQWHQNVGTCYGAGKPHFGTEAGRNVASNVADGLRKSAADYVQQAADVLAGTATVYGRERLYGGRFTTAAIENPTAQQRTNYAMSLQAEAQACRAAAVDFDARVAAWQPVAPIEVPVEQKVETVHFRSFWFSKSGHKACAGSAMGAHRGFAATTLDPMQVTCERCKNRKAYVEALAAQEKSTGC